jgi:hypothetical protein
VATTTSGDDSAFTVNLPQSTKFPIEIQAIGGTDLFTGEEVKVMMKSISTSSQETTINVSPLTTIISNAF